MTLDDYLRWDFDPKRELPDYYLLLGCGGHEDDPLALQAAVESLLSDLRKLARALRQQDYEAYERITRNILYAQKVLTNPGLKQQYDARLLKQQRNRSGAEAQADRHSIPRKAEARPAAEMPAEGKPDAWPQIELDVSAPPTGRRGHVKAKKRSPVATVVIALSAVILVGVCGWLGWMLATGDKDPRVASRPAPPPAASAPEPAPPKTADASAEGKPAKTSGSAAPQRAAGKSPLQQEQASNLPHPVLGDLATRQTDRTPADAAGPLDSDGSLPQRDFGSQAAAADPPRPTKEQIAEQLTRLRQHFADYEAIERLETADTGNRRARQQELASGLLRFSRAADVRKTPALWMASLQDAYRLAREADAYSTAAEVLTEMASNRLVSAAEVQESSASLLRGAVEAADLSKAREVYDALAEKGLAIPSSTASAIGEAVVAGVEKTPAQWSDAMALLSRLTLDAEVSLKTRAKVLLCAAADPANRRNFETYEPVAQQMLDLVPDSLRMGNLAGARLLVEKAGELPSRTSTNDPQERKKQYEARKALVARREQVGKVCEALARIANAPADAAREDRETAIAYFLGQGQFALALPHLEATGNPLFPLLRPDPEAAAPELVKKAQEIERAAKGSTAAVGQALLRYALGLLAHAQTKTEDPLLRRQIDTAMLRLGQAVGADDDPILWAKIRTAVAQQQFCYSDWCTETERHLENDFRFVAEGGGVLVGISFHEHQEWQAITAMQFVFLQPDGTETATPMYGEAKSAQATVVRAPQGLAIKTMEVKEGVRAFRLGFGPLVPSRGESADPSAQDSDWYGPGFAWKTSRRIELPSGALPIGVEGSYGVRIGRFRLVGPADTQQVPGPPTAASSTDSAVKDPTAPAQDVSSVNPLIWARIRTAVERSRLAYSDWGFRSRKEPNEFRFIPESGGVLVGINFHQNSEWQAVTAMQFVFLQSDGREAVSPMYGDAQPGEVMKVRAPEGLAIHQLILQQGDHESSNEVRAFRVGFGSVRVPGVAFRAAAGQSPMQGPGGPGKPVLLSLPGDCSIIGLEGKFGTVIGRMRVIGVGAE